MIVNAFERQSLVPQQPSPIDHLLEPIDQLMAEGRFDICYSLLRSLAALLGHHEKVTQRLKKLYKLWIPRWHFAMLNDEARSHAFFEAITAANLRDKVVLDIGAGSGLLSMMAARAGAKHVYACEMVAPVADKAEKIISLNGYGDAVTLIPKHSADIRIGVDMAERAQVLISETIDCGFVGEGFLEALCHARSHLLSPDALLIPRSFCLKGTLLESDDLYELNRVDQVYGLSVNEFNEFSTQGYFPVRLKTWNHRMLSEVQTLIELDLERYDFKPMRTHLQFEASSSGKLHGVVFWFEVELVPGVQLSNRPENGNKHWMQALTHFGKPQIVQQGDVVEIDLTLDLDTVDIRLSKEAP